MKLRHPALLSIAAAIFLPAVTHGQALLSEWELLKGIDYVQISSADPIVKTGNSYFWESYFVNNDGGGDSVFTSTTPTTSIPSGTAGTQNHTFDGDDNEWGASIVAADESTLDGLVGNGTFSTAIEFTTAGSQGGTLNLVSDGVKTFFGENPKVTSLDNAAWVDGKLQMTAGTTATITFNGLGVTGFTDSEDLMAVFIDGGGSIEQDTKFGSFTIGSGGDFDLVAGTYELEIEYINYVDVTTSDFGGSTGRAGFLNNVLVELEVVSAVPEPSSFALIGGLAVLGFVSTGRRRRA